MVFDRRLVHNLKKDIRALVNFWTWWRYWFRVLDAKASPSILSCAPSLIWSLFSLSNLVNLVDFYRWQSKEIGSYLCWSIKDKMFTIKQYKDKTVPRRLKMRIIEGLMSTFLQDSLLWKSGILEKPFSLIRSYKSCEFQQPSKGGGAVPTHIWVEFYLGSVQRWHPTKLHSEVETPTFSSLG